jgi:hypothetical protein
VPRLLLVDDDGREMFAGQVSRANVERVAQFLRANMGTLQLIARARTAVAQVFEVVDQVKELAPPSPRPRARRSRR